MKIIVNKMLMAFVWMSVASVRATVPGDAGLSGLTDPRGLSDPLYRWTAKAIAPAQPPAPEDLHDGTSYPGAVWDFNDNTTNGITRFHGVTGVQAAGGVLSFDTDDDAYFYWGNHYDDQGVTGLTLGDAWPVDPRLSFQKPWFARLRVRQSATQSVWQVAARRAGIAMWPNTLLMDQAEIEVTGTNWQEVVAPFILNNQYSPRSGFRRHSLCIMPGAAGNHVEIDWVRIACSDVCAHYRGHIVLDETPRRAVICISPVRMFAYMPAGAFKLYVNGKRVMGRNPAGLMRGYTELLDASDYFVKGDNIIAVEAAARGPVEQGNEPTVDDSLVLEGIAVYENGGFKRFATDESWKATYTRRAQWFEQDYDDADWRNAQAFGMVPATQLADGNYGSGARLRDPPYLGPIDIEFPPDTRQPDTPPIFQLRDGVKLDVALPAAPADKPLRVTARVDNAFDSKTIAPEIELKGAVTTRQGVKQTVYEYSFTPPDAGVYNLTIRAEQAGQVLDIRFEEIAVVGKIPQRAVDWNRVETETSKTLIAGIKCWESADESKFIDHPVILKKIPKHPVPPAGPISRVGERNGMKFRETGAAFGDWFSYAIDIQTPWRPHLVEVDYLDDREMGFTVRAQEATYAGCNKARANVCVFTGGIYPCSGKKQTAQFVFYPQDERCALDVININYYGLRAAISEIRVYQIDDLPAIRLPNAVQSRRFGSHTERPSLRPETFYAGPSGAAFKKRDGCARYRHYGFVRDWYQTFANQIRYMRYAGENMFVLNMFMYSGSDWPSDRFFCFSTPDYDNVALMFAMFEANGLSLVPSLEFSIVPLNLIGKNRVTDSEVQAGADTILQVSKSGEQAYWTGGTCNLNPFHPAVRAEIEAMAEELVRRYARFDSFKTFSLFSGGLCAPNMYLPLFAESLEEALDYDWSDVTVDLFAKTTGIKIPVDAADPERFFKRHDWVLQHARPEWVDFRCRGMYEAHAGIAKAARACKPDIEYLTWFFPSVDMRPIAEQAILRRRPVRDMLRLVGMDPVLYAGASGMEFGWIYMLETQARAWYPASARGLLNQFNREFDAGHPLGKNKSPACFLNTTFMEPDIVNVFNKKWVWHGRSQVNPNPTMGAPHYLAPFAERLVEMTPELMAFMWTDGQIYTSHTGLRRPFAAAFRSIPDGEYRTLAFDGLAGNIVIRGIERDGRRIFYLVNPAWWSVELQLTFNAPGALHDRVLNKPMEMQGKILSLAMAPNDLKVFECDVGLTPVAAKIVFSEDTMQWMSNLARLLEYMRRIGTDKTIELLGMRNEGDHVNSMLGELQANVSSGRYVGAWRIFTHPWMQKIVNYLRERQQKEEAGDMPRPSDVYRVNIGAAEGYTDAAGNQWLPDQAYQFGLNAHGYTGDGGRALDRGNINFENTADHKIYQTERFGFPGYRFKVNNGKYTLRIHFVESWRYIPGRLADIDIEGKPVLRRYDFAMESGGFRRPFVKELQDIEVSDGELAIDILTPKVVKFSGLEVVKSK